MTKIDIVSGFLGAGKTTLINRLVHEAYKGEKLVLIENEFGEIGIDGGFLKDAGVEITDLAFKPFISLNDIFLTCEILKLCVWPSEYVTVATCPSLYTFSKHSA